MDADAPNAVSDRVFVLVWRGADIARLRSRGSPEMFWETFLVEPLTVASRDKVFDAEAWGHVEFVLRHERTGVKLKNVFSSGGHPPRLDGTGGITVTLRGTFMFSPPDPAPSRPPILTTVRALVGHLWPSRPS